MKLLYGDRAAREVSERIAAATATTTTLKAMPADRRVDGMLVVVLNDYSCWVFEGASVAGASSTVLVPDAGNGRWVAVGISSGVTGVVTVSKAVTQAAIAALGASTTGTIDFDAALPAGAVVLASGFNVTAIVDNAGDTADVTADLGIKSGDVDRFIDGASLDAVAKVSVPAGAAPTGLVGAITPMITIDSSVNLSTITKGGFTAYLQYAVAF